MAKSAMYLNGRELRTHELKNLDRIEELKMQMETRDRLSLESRAAAFDKFLESFPSRRK